MLGAIFRFEIRHHLRNPLLYITGGLLLFLAFATITSDSVQLGGSIGHVNRNAPIVIVRILTLMSLMAVFIITAFVSSAAHRDFAYGTHELFFSRPVRRWQYLLGRFAGAVSVSLMVMLGPALGLLVGSLMPWLEPERLGPTTAAPYLFSLVVMVLPNVLLLAALFFTLTSLTRSMLATYLSTVAVLVGYLLARLLAGELGARHVAVLLDPFGEAALSTATRYWTIVEENSLLPDLAGPLLANRLLWLAVAAILLAIGVWRFRTTAPASRQRPRNRVSAPAQPALALALPTTARPVGSRRSFAAPARRAMLAHQTWMEVRAVLGSVPFLVMTAFAVLNVVFAASFDALLYGTPSLPVTALMLEAIQGSYAFVLMIVLAFYAGELVWRERALDLGEVTDALPAPSWVFLAAKTSALVAVAAVFLLVGALATIGFQLVHGYTHLEPMVYAQGLAIQSLPYLLSIPILILVQVMARTKLLGYLVVLVYLVLDDAYDAFHLDHHLYHLASLPSVPYSDMNGWGHLLEPAAWYALYWGCLGVVLLGLAALLWRRGTDEGWRRRVREARQRWGGAPRWAVSVGGAAFVLTGCWIYYNTNVLNEYIPTDLGWERSAAYERQYRQYRDLPQPRIADVSADVDIFPAERRVEVRGRYRLVNRTERPITTLHLSFEPLVHVNRLELPAHTVRLEDSELGYRILELESPLAPGAQIELGFDLTVEHHGFLNHGSNTRVVANGTFFNNRDVFPSIGYDPFRELGDRNVRRRLGLEPIHRLAPADDLEARRNTYFARDSDWVSFATTVSTSADQVAVAPGYLEREWRDGDRRFFHYAMDAPILNFFCYLSADYQVYRDRWRDVAIEIYHHPPHRANLGRMVEAVRKTLAYCTANFGPYQHRQVRILEFPRYEQFAQSFANTIPYSEAFGFVARVAEADDIDYVFYVTAHEVAHQWWAHQVIGGDVQGATMLSEALAQYTALMVMEQEYGRHQMRRFLKYELDRYLEGRSHEMVEEMPLARVEDQPYIHYRKGSVVTYALRDALGESTVNRALARYVAAVAFQQPPFTASSDLLALLREEAPPGSDALLEDLFETITLYSNRVVTATAAQRPDGRFSVHLEVDVHKARADGYGVETEVPLDDWIDVGVFGTDDEVLYLVKHHLSTTRATIELVVDDRPVTAGIDPYNLLVDRDSNDNRAVVEVG